MGLAREVAADSFERVDDLLFSSGSDVDRGVGILQYGADRLGGCRERFRGQLVIREQERIGVAVGRGQKRAEKGHGQLG